MSTTTKPLMACGHSANATDGHGDPVCAICIVREIAPDPVLTDRWAHCTYGKHAEVPSSVHLAFFKHRPEQERDLYYCGCYGWD